MARLWLIIDIGGKYYDISKEYKYKGEKFDMMSYFEKKRREHERRQKAEDVKKLAVGTMIGAGIGSLLGILFAPQSGEETREDIVEKSKEVTEKAKDVVDQKLEEAKELQAKAKEELQAKLDEINSKKIDMKKEALDKLEDGIADAENLLVDVDKKIAEEKKDAKEEKKDDKKGMPVNK